MNITFYYVPGISELDTPVFDTLANQSSFFAESEPFTIDMGFYPPFLKNTLLIDVSDYNLTTSVANYCSLEFNNKKFYYFITSKEYVNETVVRLTIKMDTVQTYMFDADFINAFIERQSISRWVRNSQGIPTNVINRNYIRENLSKGSFSKCDYYYELNTSTANNASENTIWNWVYVAKFASQVPGSGQQTASRVINFEVNNTIKYTYVSPFDYGISPAYADTIVKGSDTYSTTSSAISRYGTTQNRIVDAYLIPFKAFKNLGALNNSNYGIGVNEYVSKIDDNVANSNLIFFGTNAITYINMGSTFVIPNFSKIPLGGNFDPYKIPVMLDENYINFTIGDPNVRCEYPLFNLSTVVIKYAYWADITSGARYYNLYKNLGSPDDNEYNTIAVNATALKLDLKNNPWETYISNNRATLLGSTAISVTNLLGSMAGGAIKGGSAGAASGLISGTTGVINNQLKYAIEEQNKKHAPDSIKRLGQMGGDLAGREEIISIRRYYCDDFKEVAIFYETCGYKVSYVTNQSLFELHERVFYDYVMTTELNVLIGDKATEEDFIRRFNQGIRLWHTNDGVLECRVYGFGLGQLCIKDNVEYYDGIFD